MSIIGHVRGDKSPLWKLLVRQIFIKMSEVLDLASLGFILDKRVVKDQWVMLADIVWVISVLVGVVVALETGVRHMLLVLAPRDTLGVQQINNGRNIFRDPVEVVIVHSKGITTHGSTVIWLGRMGQSVEIGPERGVRI